VIVIPPMLHNHLHLHIALTTRKNALSLGTFKEVIIFRKIEEYRTEEYFKFFMHKGGRM